jgi:hypothetical protein
MNSNAFDSLARHAVGMSRRGSLRALAGMAMAAALAAPANARAGKAGKKKRAKQQCKQQKSQCVTTVTDFCALTLNPALCEGDFLPCCEEFTGCNVDAGIGCILTVD